MDEKNISIIFRESRYFSCFEKKAWRNGKTKLRMERMTEDFADKTILPYAQSIIDRLLAENGVLKTRILALEKRLNKSSETSHNPPSRDILKKTVSLREDGEKRGKKVTRERNCSG